MLIFTFILTVSHLRADSLKGLEQVFNELEYSLNVEWDQKDEVFKANVLNKFQRELNELKQNGLTQADIVDFTLARIKKPELRLSLQRAHQDLQNGFIGEEEFESEIKKLNSMSHLQGANWSGFTPDEAIYFAAFILVVLIVVKIEGHKKL